MPEEERAAEFAAFKERARRDYELTRPVADFHGRLWSEHEELEVIERIDDAAREVALALGRTSIAVLGRRGVLRRRGELPPAIPEEVDDPPRQREQPRVRDIEVVHEGPLTDEEQATIAWADPAEATAALAARLGRLYWTVHEFRQRIRRTGGWGCPLGWTECRGCGRPLAHRKLGRPPLHCESCRPDHTREYGRAKYHRLKSRQALAMAAEERPVYDASPPASEAEG
jgi:hypothetical protein